MHKLTANWPTNPRKDALGLRLTGALHHAVLSGAAPALAAIYPAAKPNWDMAQVWSLARAYLSENLETVAAFIQHPPQTNETRRAIALLPGFLELAAKFDTPMHLLELGASAGLNQNWDRFSYETETWSRPGSGPVKISTDWKGAPPAHLDASIKVASRAACDLKPLDIHDPAQALKLKCYTWPDQAERLLRLEAAIKLAQGTGTLVEQADAAAWTEARLATRPVSGLTVIYHSVFLVYPPKDQIARIMDAIRSAGETATPEAPLAWLCYEPEGLFGGARDTAQMVTHMQVWPGGEARILGEADGHVTYFKPS